MGSTENQAGVPAVAEVVAPRSREDLLRELLDDLTQTLRGEDLFDDRKRFYDLIVRSMDLLGLSDIDVAARIDVSRAAVCRWRLGRAWSSRATREKALTLLKRLVKKGLASKQSD